MPRHFSMATRARARDLFFETGSVQEVARRLEVTASTVYNWKKAYAWVPRENRHVKKNKNKCTCCGIRNKWHGHRFLCLECFKNADNIEHNPVHI